MIQISKQSWKVGDRVNVGFMRGLEVIDIRPIKDGLPDIYILQADNGCFYEFIPHNGLHRIDCSKHNLKHQ